MSTHHPFRFGVINEAMLPSNEWVAQAQRIETLGYATFLIRDHFVPDFFGDQYAPVAALATVASVTSRLRIGTLVLDNDYRHPVLLAKEAATLDVLSGGRLELGMGAGWLRSEYERAGILFDTAGTRIDRLAESLQAIKRLFGEGTASFAGAHYRIENLEGVPRPVQQPHPPILVGGGKRRMLRLAGREADIVSLLTTSVASGTVVDDPRERLADAVDRKIGWVRDGAGSRFDDIELSLIPTVMFTDNRCETGAELIRQRKWQGITVEQVLEMPSILIGSTDQIIDAIERRRQQFGISYYVVSDGIKETFAPIVARMAGT